MLTSLDAANGWNTAQHVSYTDNLTVWDKQLKEIKINRRTFIKVYRGFQS